MCLTRRPALFAAALLSLASCATPDRAANDRDDTTGGVGRRQALAPIEAVELVVRESFPPQYAVRIVSGLPSGCALFDRVDVLHGADIIELTVWNTLPADEGIACTMIYGTADNTTELGSLEPGQPYAVHVNGESRLTFTTQGD